MLCRHLVLLALLLSMMILSGCYNTDQRIRQTGDNLEVLLLDGETPVLWME